MITYFIKKLTAQKPSEKEHLTGLVLDTDFNVIKTTTEKLPSTSKPKPPKLTIMQPKASPLSQQFKNTTNF
jgi:hypothetical protein